MSTTTNTTTLPESFVNATNKIVALVTKEQTAIQKAMAYTLDHIGAPAQVFAAEHDAYAHAVGSPLVKKSGNVNDVQVREAMLNAGVVLPSKSVIDRILRIGRNLPQGEAVATLNRFKDAEWTQPDEAIVGDTAETRTNERTVQSFDTWLQYVSNAMADSKKSQYVMADDVLLKADEHAALCAVPVEAVEEESTDEEEEESTDEVTPDEAIYGPTPKNIVNTGALLAVFATCDDATISAAVQHDLSQYGDDPAELRALALSALALAEMIDRNASPVETVAETVEA